MLIKEHNGWRLTDENRITVIHALAIADEPLDWIDPTDNERAIYEEVKRLKKQGIMSEIPF